MRIVLTTMFEREHDTEFDYLEAWRELRYEPKWMALPGANSNARPDKKRASSLGEDNTTASQLATESADKQQERAAGIQKQKAARLLEASNQRLADAAEDMAKSSKRKAELEEMRISVLQEPVYFRSARVPEQRH
ncbi:hypothetical protein PC128_g13215 [Phytophthora cactorum]|nr:hypothetical protein PC128_g13215 [Phytophthora cactorum]